jgi:hypothetical protein
VPYLLKVERVMPNLDDVIKAILQRRENALYWANKFSEDNYDSSAEQQQAIADSLLGVLYDIGEEARAFNNV